MEVCIVKQGYTREGFQAQITKVLYSLDNNVIQTKIIEEIVSKGYSRGFVADIMEGNALLETLSLIDLGVIADAIYKIANIESMKLDIYLEEAEIEQVKRYKVRQEKEDKELLVFENAIQMAHDMWAVVVPPQRIARLYRENAVGYDFETQREPRNIKSGDFIIQAANVNWISVEEIKDNLVKGLFIPNTITFNVPIEFSEEVRYDSNRNQLVILDKVLKILDGFHRSLGIIAALRETDISQKFIIMITNFDTDKARRFIIQEDKRNPINKEYIKSIDTIDRITVLVNSLNESSDSELNGLISTDNSLIRSGDALVGFNTMYDVINKLWKPVTLVETNKISEYLKDFFNEIVGCYPNEFKLQIKESRRFKIINHEQMFVLYLVLAKKLEGESNWKQELEKILNKINAKDINIVDIANTSISEIRKKMNNYIDIADKAVEEVLENDK